MNIDSAIELVRIERKRQMAKWGTQNHDDGTWLQILMEEVGELSEARLHDKFGGPKSGTALKELVQVAAVAVQMIEMHDCTISAQVHRNSNPAAQASTSKRNRKRCVLCHGTGEYITHGGRWVICTKCHGTGYAPEEKGEEV